MTIIQHTCTTDVIQAQQIKLDEQQRKIERLQAELRQRSSPTNGYSALPPNVSVMEIAEAIATAFPDRYGAIAVHLVSRLNHTAVNNAAKVELPAAYRDSIEQHLTRQEWQLFKVLHANLGHTLRTEELTSILGKSSNHLWVLVNRVRAALEEHCPTLRLLTVRKIGYRLETER